MARGTSPNEWDAARLVLEPALSRMTHPKTGNGVRTRLQHLRDELVNVLLAVASIAALDEVVAEPADTAARIVHLERPQKLGAVLEVGANVVDLVHEILHADHSALGLLTEGVLDDLVVREGDTLAADLAEAALVNQLLDRLESRVAVHDVRVDFHEVVHDGLVHLHEDAVVDLEEAQNLHDVARLGVHPVDTAQAHHEEQLRLWLHVKGAGLARRALQRHERRLLVLVLLDVRLRALEG